MVIQLGSAQIALISIPGLVATVVYIIVGCCAMRSMGTRLSTQRIIFWILVILPSIFTVQPERIEHGWKLGPMTCATVAIAVSLLAIIAQCISGLFAAANKILDPLLSKFEWPEMLFLITIAHALGDVYGAIQFSTPASKGIIGGAGLLDGLVWVPPFITIIYALVRQKKCK